MAAIPVPNVNELQITLIGSGGGYGESAVIHLANNEWVIVDSCINPNDGYPLPLEYLGSIGVNCESDVKLIICTHWHDDHILGISKVFEVCKSANFCMANVHDQQKFLQMVSLDFEKLEKTASKSSTKEFGNCLNLLASRGKKPKVASADKILYRTAFNDLKIEVISLSPSDEAIHNFDNEISLLITEYGSSQRKIVLDSPNDKSVVILIKAGVHSAILGADLEVSTSQSSGWNDILNNSNSIERLASYFKIPHHGSENGYSLNVWDKLLIKNPTSTLTPWNKKNKLPQPNMLDKFCGHSKSVYITSKNEHGKPKKREREIEKIITKSGYNIKEVKYIKGIICSKVDLQSDNSLWETSTFDSAYHVNKELNINLD